METNQKKVLTVPIRLATILILYSMLFQFMHWPYGIDLMLYSSIVLAVFYTIRFLYKHNKSHLDYVKLAIVVTWFLRVFIGTFISPRYSFVFDVILIGLGIWWFTEEGVNFYTHRKFRFGNTFKLIYYMLFALSFLICVVGMLVRIMHWPYGALIFTSGVMLISIFLLLDLFLIKRK